MRVPSQDLNVALLPLDIKFTDVDYNLRLTHQRIKSLPADTDLVLLPEMMNIGFGNYPGGIARWAEDDNGPTLMGACNMSREFDIAICGGYVARESDGIYNRCFFVADGEVKALYNKRHLFDGLEQRDFCRGEALPPIIDYRSWRLCPVICYDVRFPVWTRAVANNYDALLVVANWPASRSYIWKHLLMARAIENQAFVAGCNREGEDGYGVYSRGDSMIVNPVGVPVGVTLDDGTVTGKFAASNIADIRKGVRPWRVADRFTLDLQ